MTGKFCSGGELCGSETVVLGRKHSDSALQKEKKKKKTLLTPRLISFHIIFEHIRINKYYLLLQALENASDNLEP